MKSTAWATGPACTAALAAEKRDSKVALVALRDTFVYVDDTCDTDAARNCIAEIREMIVEAHEHYTSEMLQEYLWGDDGAFMP